VATVVVVGVTVFFLVERQAGISAARTITRPTANPFTNIFFIA
jgi:hypothetical protein